MVAVPIATAALRRNLAATKSSARRCLFGRFDHRKINESLERELRNLDQQSVKKWDFDFVQERPLPGGRFAWVAVEKTEYVPRPYIRDYPVKPTRPRTEGGLKRRLNFDEEEGFSTPGCGEDAKAVPQLDEETAVNTCSEKSDASSTDQPRTSRRIVQSQITAFYQQRKRHRSDKS